MRSSDIVRQPPAARQPLQLQNGVCGAHQALEGPQRERGRGGPGHRALQRAPPSHRRLPAQADQRCCRQVPAAAQQLRGLLQALRVAGACLAHACSAGSGALSGCASECRERWTIQRGDKCHPMHAELKTMSIRRVGQAVRSDPAVQAGRRVVARDRGHRRAAGHHPAAQAVQPPGPAAGAGGRPGPCLRPAPRARSPDGRPRGGSVRRAPHNSLDIPPHSEGA